MKPMLALRDVGVRLGRRDILASVDLDLLAGTLTVLLGPNGAGKSTLLRVMTGELTPESGVAHFLGEDLATIPPPVLARRRAVLPQSANLAFPFTVREVVALGQVRQSQIASHDRQRTLTQALERVGLAGFGGRLFQELSGGEQQRVHLARVLCQISAPLEDGAARALFLDEPTTSLDIRHQVEVLRIARAFANEGGMVFTILHDLNLGAAFADRYLVMADGRIALDGVPAAVLSHPRLADIFGLPLERVCRTGRAIPIVVPRAA